MIFDCCHSGSGTRTFELDPTWLIRGVEVRQPFRDSKIDREIWNDVATAPLGRGTRPPPHFAYCGLGSHVYLAACGAEEKAQEAKGQGKFTTGLLKVLTAPGSEKLTYNELIKRIPDIPG